MKLTTKLILQRKQKGMSQAQLAETIHVTRQAVSRWEVGDAFPSIDNLRLLSQLYGLPMEYFLDEDREVPEQPAALAESVDLKDHAKRLNWRPWVILTVVIIVLLVAALVAVIGRNEYKSGNIQIDTIDVSSDWGDDFNIEW